MDFRSTVCQLQTVLITEYQNHPERLQEDAGNELNISSGYESRYVLELLQNADDAQTLESELEPESATRVGSPSIVFHLTSDFLYCANGGFPLSDRGLRSLCHLSVSAKQRQALTIGHKGIGFKSVLGVTENPQVFWHDGAVEWSRERTFQHLHAISPSSSEFRAFLSGLGPQGMPLIRFPFDMDLRGELAADPILCSLWNNCATVFRFPLKSNVTTEKVWRWLKQIRPTTLLFLNYLKTIEIITEDYGVYSFAAERDEPCFELGVHESTAIITNHKGQESLWTIVTSTFEVDKDILQSLPPDWRKVELARVAFALEEEDCRLVPYRDLSAGDAEGVHYPPLMVHFPTSHQMPIPMLLHGTFRTNVDRELLTQDEYNEWLLAKAVALLSEEVLAVLSSYPAKDHGQILDFFHGRRDMSADDFIVTAFWEKLKQALSSRKFVTDHEASGRVAPCEVLLTPEGIDDVGTFKHLLLGQTGEARKFCHSDVESNRSRCRTLELLGAAPFDPLDIPHRLAQVPEHVRGPEWASQVYVVLEQLYRSQRGERKSEFIETCRSLPLMHVEGDRWTACKDTGQGPLFFSPIRGISEVGSVPSGLKLRFFQRDTQERYQELVGTSLRASWLGTAVGVDEYAEQPIVLRVIIPAIDEFWQCAEDRLTFNPAEMLVFLESLLASRLDEEPWNRPTAWRKIDNTPVPVKGQPQYAPAYQVYFSQGWTASDALELLYSFDPQVPFLTDPDQTWDEDTYVRREALYTWLGVARLPRILSQFSPIDDDRWSSCGWMGSYGGKFNSPHAALPAWDDYSRFVRAWIGQKDGENPFHRKQPTLRSSLALDRFKEIVSDPLRALRLLCVIAENWHIYKAHTRSELSYRKSRNGPWYTVAVPSYFGWCLQETAWLPPVEHIEYWGFRKPREIFRRDGDLQDQFGTLLPYLELSDTRPSVRDGFGEIAEHLGIRRSQDQLDPVDWWSIVDRLPQFYGNDGDVPERFIKPIYRKMLTAAGGSHVSLTKDAKERRGDFLKHGQLLCEKDRQLAFVPAQEAWYVDTMGYQTQFEAHVHLFALQRENRSAAVNRAFEMPDLESNVTSSVQVGDADPHTELVQKHLDEVKPCLLARVFAEWNSDEVRKRAASKLRDLELIAVKKLSVTLTLDHERLSEPIVVHDDDAWSYLGQDGSEQDSRVAKWAIYLHARQFELGGIDEVLRDTRLGREVGLRVAEHLGINLGNDFALLLNARTHEDRTSILRNANVGASEVAEAQGMLSEAEKPPAPEPPAIDAPDGTSSNDTQDPVQDKVGGNGHDEGTPSTGTAKPEPLVVWWPDELGFGEAEDYLIGDGRGGKGHGQGGGPGHRTSKDETDLIDQASMALVMAYERRLNRFPKDVSSPRSPDFPGEYQGYDIQSYDPANNETRLIEVKGSGQAPQYVEVTAPEWETARRQPRPGEIYYLYQVRYLDKRKGRMPELLIYRDPYRELTGEPVRFKVNLRKFKSPPTRVPITRNDDKDGT